MKAYHWFIRYDLSEENLRIPHVVVFGGNQINSSIYYHDASVRTDTPHFIFQYTLSGKGIFRYKGEEHELTAGKAFFCNSHDPEMAYYYPPEGTETYEMLFCCLCGNLETYEDIANRYGRVFELPKEDKAIKQFLNYRVKSHYTKHLDMNVSESFRTASTLMTSLIKSKETEVLLTSSLLIDRVNNYLQEHIEEKFSIKQLAETFEVSASHLSREFKRQTGLSPQKHMDILRMNHAARLLTSNLLSVKEAAYKMGFDNPAHFVRSFKRVHGVTPGSLKK
jgi:AraC-like DNA-binding protein